MRMAKVGDHDADGEEKGGKVRAIMDHHERCLDGQVG